MTHEDYHAAKRAHDHNVFHGHDPTHGNLFSQCHIISACEERIRKETETKIVFKYHFTERMIRLIIQKNYYLYALQVVTYVLTFVFHFLYFLYKFTKEMLR